MSKKKIVNEYPDGWDEARVRRVLEYYENQTEEEAVAEDEAAFEHEDTCMVEVPNELLPAVSACGGRRFAQELLDRDGESLGEGRE